ERGMGLALWHARHLSATAEQIAVWDGNPPAGPVGTAVDMANWRRTGLAQRVIPVGNGYRPSPGTARPQGVERETHAMLFGDVKGFSRLTDDQLPRFIEVFLGGIAQVIERYRTDIRFANTWGDGLFLVFGHAAA